MLHVKPRVEPESAGGEADDADDGVDGPRSEAAALGVVDVREDRGGGDGFDAEGRGVEDLGHVGAPCAVASASVPLKSR